jgi:hypothetical protein
MAVMARDSWTDERLDDLNTRIDRGFDRGAAATRDLRTEMKEEFAACRAETKAGDDALRLEMREGFDRVDARFDAMYRTMITGLIAILGCMFTGFATVIAALS